MRNISIGLAATALALAAVTTSAHADTVSFPNYAHGSESVNYSLNYGTGNPLNVSGSAGAGGFLTNLNMGPTFESYCVDLYHNISFGVAYTDYSGPTASHLFHNTNAGTDLGRLYARAGAVNTSVLEAAFQIAAWEIAFENTGTAYNVLSGAATFTGGSADTMGALTLANTWLTSLGSGGPGIRVLESTDHQSVMTPVPEPETYALLMAGLAAIGFVARRRKV